MCIYKLDKQDIANLRKFHLCQSRGTTFVNLHFAIILWLCSLVWHSKIKSHSLHCSDLLKKHMQQHIESICVICQKKFNARKDLKRHTQVHEVQRCEECGKWFSSKKEYRSHRQTHKKKTNDDEEVDILGLDLDTIELELI